MLETPAIVIDEEVMINNIQKMADHAKKHDVLLRPHIKTHKIPEIAGRQIDAGAAGITCAKVAEAEVMASEGITNIFIAYPIVTPEKIKRFLALSKTIDITVGVDSSAGAKALSKAAAEADQTVKVRLEVDVGLKRTGVKYEKAVELAKQIYQLNNLEFTGIYTFKGAIINGKATLDLQGAGAEEGQLMTELADSLKREGIIIQEVSAGSTPTSGSVAEVSGITEIRPGTYVFYDRMQKTLGVCGFKDCAARVIATIVSIPSDDLLIIDGGSKTFATDVQPNTEPLNLQGFGYIVNYPEAVLERLTEEHGMVKIDPGYSFQIGDTLEIIPNHVCSTINLHNYVYIKQANGGLCKTEVLARGKLE
ncbi:alanine racemase [Alteribacillus sp. HJP-4]|uniref:alanine racemase n=1 Tax=Alteribacillus sp. HJP-4 TaxID=2775394 RepID=UPI0035CCFF49